jgi:mitofusin
MQPYHPPTPRHQYSSPATPDSPAFEKESHIGSEASARQAREAADGVVRDYEDKRDRWVAMTLGRRRRVIRN